MQAVEKTRFDTRLPKEQKEMFEYAAVLGGFKTLSEFLIFSAQQEANKIIEKQQTILASQKDRNIFFDSLMNAQEPNANLKKAVERYNNSDFNL